MIEKVRISTEVGVFDALAAGPADGRAVLLLHGFPQGGLEWEHQLAALAGSGYRAVAPDLRGYSPQVRPSEAAEYRVDELVRDTLRIADALGWPRFDVVGHDWGAVLAWVLADQHQDRIRTLTAVSVPHPQAFVAALRGDEDQQRRSGYLRMFQDPAAAERMLLADGAAALRGMWRGALPPERVDAYVARLAEPGALAAALSWYRATRPDEVTAGLITVPTLYVWSTQDAGVGSTAAVGTKEWVGGDYRFEILEGISHWVPEEAGDQLSAAVLEHLARYADS
ncbi:alpha/beta hydrolase [Micromonospora sp. WMMD1082]|uniref:alpha/beta fold hydrolase n=1 Tax=Micromonospora sp. WMMD1082 TaxID=3016104 RepID=UPI00241781D1|nr:alpha/beta hydrolase [Micromonospora sp. WMMD1082]MDG4792781.1 alpha/beta hydrolase [Micromonospora sp. WMMD1082]